jgi:hypothetical protein
MIVSFAQIHPETWGRIRVSRSPRGVTFQTHQGGDWFEFWSELPDRFLDRPRWYIKLGHDNFLQLLAISNLHHTGYNGYIAIVWSPYHRL